MADGVTIGALKRLSQLMAGQSKSAVSITGGSIAGQTSVSSDKYISTVTVATTAAAMSNGGVSTFGSSLGTTYVLAAPVAGVEKFLYNTGTTSIVATNSTAVQIGESSSVQRVNFTAAGQGITLVGLSATKWGIVSQNSSLITATT